MPNINRIDFIDASANPDLTATIAVVRAIRHCARISGPHGIPALAVRDFIDATLMAEPIDDVAFNGALTLAVTMGTVHYKASVDTLFPGAEA